MTRNPLGNPEGVNGCILASLRGIEGQRRTQSEQLQKSLARIDALLQAPRLFDGALRGRGGSRSRGRAVRGRCKPHTSRPCGSRSIGGTAPRPTATSANGGYPAAACQAGRGRGRRLTLLARCMSNDGLIALAIDDAGPALSGLANELLMASLWGTFHGVHRDAGGDREGGASEGFDIVVHDAESGESKSVRMMSGGERV